MAPYIDAATYMLTFLYDQARVAVDPHSSGSAEILAKAGFTRKDGKDIGLDLRRFAAEPVFENPCWIYRGAAHGFLECKLLSDLANPTIEVQLGGPHFWEDAIWGDKVYSLEHRDQIAALVEEMAALPGFRCGFAIHLGDEEDERDYREWFAECVVNGEFSLGRFIRQGWLSPHALFVAREYVERHGRDHFLKCPAWKISEPRESVLCIFFDNLLPSGDLRRKHEVSFIRDALPFLRERLPNE